MKVDVINHTCVRLWTAVLIAVAALWVQPAVVRAQDTQPYVLGPDDVVNVAVARHPEFSGEFLIPADGSVTLPGAGQTVMVGRSLPELAANITENLRSRLKSPEVTVTLKTPRKRQVYVMGAVAKAGLYDIGQDWHCSEAIAAAGGLHESVRPNECKASLRRAGSDKSEPVDLTSILKQGSTDPGPSVRHGDTLLIESPEMVSVYVLGKVRNPGTYKVRKDGATILEALALAGGEADNSALTKVTVTHASGTSDTYDLTSAIKSGKPESAPKVQAMDVILVPEQYSGVVVLGYVNQPGPVPIRGSENLTLVEAISQARGVAKKGNVGTVTIVRSEEGKQQRMSYDVNKFLRSGDASQNPPLKSGDVVYVPGSGRPDWSEVLNSAATMALIVSPFRVR